PAYVIYDTGRAALADGRLDDAERAANEALRLLPAEAQFHALAGDVDLARQRYDAAAGHYGDAIARHDAFFYYPLQRGLARQRLGQLDGARSDIERSLALLPTADGYYALGAISEQRGDRTGALEAYRLAAASDSSAGRAAQDATVRLDLPQNPGAYLDVQSGLDADGLLLLQIGNPTRVAVEEVVVTVRYTGDDGGVRQVSRQLPGALDAGEARRVATGLGPFAGPQAYQVSVTGAR